MRALIVVRLSRVTDATTSPERQHFDVPQMVELTHIVALENLRAVQPRPGYRISRF